MAPDSDRLGLEERLLGFDVRITLSPADAEARWSDERRRVLRREASLPHSVDAIVWPSLFDEIDLPPWIGPNAVVWEDLQLMLQHLTAHPQQTVQAEVIAISVFAPPGPRPVEAGAPYLEPTLPPHIQSGWQRLGLDVADGGLISSLMNCGYKAEELGSVQERFADQLNAHHLFEDLDTALAFRTLSDPRIKEHAPFWVYGLYRVGPWR